MKKWTCPQLFKTGVTALHSECSHLCLIVPVCSHRDVHSNHPQWMHLQFTQGSRCPKAREDTPSHTCHKSSSPRYTQLCTVIWSFPQPHNLKHPHPPPRAVDGCASLLHKSSTRPPLVQFDEAGRAGKAHALSLYHLSIYWSPIPSGIFPFLFSVRLVMIYICHLSYYTNNSYQLFSTHQGPGISFKCHQNCEVGTTIILFYRWGNEGIVSFYHVPKITQLECGGIRIQTQV